MSKIFLQIYYCLLFCILFRYSYYFLYEIPPQTPNYALFAYPLNFLGLPVWTHSLFFLCSLFSCLSCILIPNKSLKIITSILVLLIFSIKYSYGKIGHENHIWMISSVLMCVFSLDKSLNFKTNLFTLRLIQALLLSHYFISGLWKFRYLLEYPLKDIALEAIAWTLTIYADEPNIFLKVLLYQYPTALCFGFLCILIFQLSALIPVFLNRFFVLYGVLTILFHISTSIAIGVSFRSTVPAVLFFLIISETMRKKELTLAPVRYKLPQRIL